MERYVFFDPYHIPPGLHVIGVPTAHGLVWVEITVEEYAAAVADAEVTRQLAAYAGEVLASLLGRGAACITYKGPRGAIVQIGMAVMAHSAATLRRIHQDRLSTRAQKFRRLLRLKRHKANEFKGSKN